MNETTTSQLMPERIWAGIMPVAESLWGTSPDAFCKTPYIRADEFDKLQEREARLVEALGGLVDAFVTPLPDDEAENLKGSNDPWISWYPPHTIVNSEKAEDTGPRMIARICKAVAEAQKALAAADRGGR